MLLGLRSLWEQVNASAGGALLVVTVSLIAGGATGDANTSAQTLSDNVTIVAGGATGSALTTAQTLTATASLLPGGASGFVPLTEPFHMSAMFSWVDWVKTQGVLTAGNQASTLPVQNLADPRLQKVARFLATTIAFNADFGAAVPIRVLGLFGATLASTDTVRWRLSNIAAGGGDVLDTTAVASGVTARYNQSLTILNAAVNARYLQCDIVATSRASLGYVDIGRLWAGDIWAPSILFDWGWGANWVDAAQRSKPARSGVRFTSDGALYRRMTVNFSWLTAADKAQAMEMDAACGTRGQLLFIPDTDGTPNTEAILGSMGDGGTASVSGAVVPQTQIIQPAAAYPARYTKSYVIEEDR